MFDLRLRLESAIRMEAISNESNDKTEGTTCPICHKKRKPIPGIKLHVDNEAREKKDKKSSKTAIVTMESEGNCEAEEVQSNVVFPWMKSRTTDSTHVPVTGKRKYIDASEVGLFCLSDHNLAYYETNNGPSKLSQKKKETFTGIRQKDLFSSDYQKRSGRG